MCVKDVANRLNGSSSRWAVIAWKRYLNQFQKKRWFTLLNQTTREGIVLLWIAHTAITITFLRLMRNKLTDNKIRRQYNSAQSRPIAACSFSSYEKRTHNRSDENLSVTFLGPEKSEYMPASSRIQFWIDWTRSILHGFIFRTAIAKVRNSFFWLHNFVHSSFVGIRKFETTTISKHKSTADSGNAYPAGTHSIRTPVLLSVSAPPCVFLLSMV